MFRVAELSQYVAVRIRVFGRDANIQGQYKDGSCIIELGDAKSVRCSMEYGTFTNIKIYKDSSYVYVKFAQYSGGTISVIGANYTTLLDGSLSTVDVSTLTDITPAS